jgi:thiamine-phosphate pyrophosphorylase
MMRATEARLYIVVEAGKDPRAVEGLLTASGAAVLLIAPACGNPLDASAVKPLVDVALAKGVAALIESDARLARTLRAGGVHLPWSKDVVARYGEAREVLGGRFIVGADAGRSRHDAMTLAEAGADYVGFGIPRHVEDRETARARRLDLVEWWSGIFEVPCVAFDVETEEDAAALIEAGADFVAVRAPADLRPTELSRWAHDLAQALAAPEDVA